MTIGTRSSLKLQETQTALENFKTTIDASWSLKVTIIVITLLQQPKTIAGEHQSHLPNYSKTIEQSALGLANQWQRQSHCD